MLGWHTHVARSKLQMLDILMLAWITVEVDNTSSDFKFNNENNSIQVNVSQTWHMTICFCVDGSIAGHYPFFCSTLHCDYSTTLTHRMAILNKASFFGTHLCTGAYILGQKWWRPLHGSNQRVGWWQHKGCSGLLHRRWKGPQAIFSFPPYPSPLALAIITKSTSSSSGVFISLIVGK